MQPGLQVPIELGAWHFGPVFTGPGTSQQISPTPQHSKPQQSDADPQVVVLQGGVPHVPMSQ
jgi:hypothetical protein